MCIPESEIQTENWKFYQHQCLSVEMLKIGQTTHEGTYHISTMISANYFSALPVVKLYDSQDKKRPAGTQVNFQVTKDNYI